MDIKRGVDYYTKARLSIDVFFPENKVVCQYCKFIKSEFGLGRSKCILTDEIIVFIRDTVGNKCPLIFIEQEDA